MSLDKLFYKTLFKDVFSDACEVVFWDGDVEKYGVGEQKFKIIFHEPIPKADIIKDPSLAFGEGYMNGKFDIEGSIRQTVRGFINYKNAITGKNGKYLSILKKISNNIKVSKNNVSFHYDIGNDFYRLWLDDTMTYSCGYYQSLDNTLTEAQTNKVNHILRKLYLSEGQALLDIGCGWGHLIINAAKLYRVKATGITLSTEQYNFVKERIKEEGLEEWVDVKFLDYREIKDRQFDRIISVGMLEHVGKDHIAEYFSQIQNILKPTGISMLHCITSQSECETDSWIDKYIFPGGYIPALGQLILEIIEQGFHVLDVENLRRHYAKTLECWAENFEKALPEIRATKNEAFIRMWRLYLNVCAASFDTGSLSLHQILFSNSLNEELPWTREYMYT